MAKKSSRKGKKKAWRSTQEVDERAAREERSGGSLDAIPGSSDVSPVKKTGRYREKFLISDTLLERTCLWPFFEPKKKMKKAKSAKEKLTSDFTREVKDKDAPWQDFDIWGSGDVSLVKKMGKYIEKFHNFDTLLESTSLVLPFFEPKKKMKKAKSTSDFTREVKDKDVPWQDFDIWGSGDVSPVKETGKYREKFHNFDTLLESTSLVLPFFEPKKKMKQAKLTSDFTREVKDKDAPWQDFDIWGAGDNSNKEENGSKKASKSKKKGGLHHAAPAVDVGCSYSPQDALGLASAQEMHKVYLRQLEPPPILRLVPGTTTIMDEEDAHFLEVADDVEEPSGAEEQHARGPRPPAFKLKRLSRADLNKKKRRKEQMQVEDEVAYLAKFQKDLDRLSELERKMCFLWKNCRDAPSTCK